MPFVVFTDKNAQNEKQPKRKVNMLPDFIEKMDEIKQDFTTWDSWNLGGENYFDEND